MGMPASSGAGVEALDSRVCPDSLRNPARTCDEPAIPAERARAENEGGDVVTTEAFISAWRNLLCETAF